MKKLICLLLLFYCILVNAQVYRATSTATGITLTNISDTIPLLKQ